MQNEIIDKLTGELSAAISTERQVVYVLVEIRKLLDLEGTRDKYKVLEFYCHWAVHPQLSRNSTARQVVREFDQAITSVESAIQRVQEIISFIEFRNEMEVFLEEHGLPKNVTDDPLAWVDFAKNYVGVISDCPLICTNSQLNNIDQIVFTRVDAQHNNTDTPLMPALVIQCEASKNKTVLASFTFRLDDSAQGQNE